MQAEARDGKTTLARQKELEFSISALEEQLKGQTATREVCEMWTDGEQVHLRRPLVPLSPTEVDRRWDSPAVPLDASHLHTDFAKVYMVSFVPSKVESLRVWAGVGEDGKGTGIVGSKPIEQVTSVRYPPFATPRQSVDSPYKRADWVTWLMTRPKEELRVIADNEDLDGHSTVVLRHQTAENVEFGKESYSGEIEIATITTAWLDMERGFVPLQIHRSREWLHDGRRVNARDHEPILRVALSHIQKLRTGGYYPFQVVESWYVADPDEPRSSALRPSSIIAGDVPFLRLALFEVSHMVVWAFEPKQPPTKAMLDLVFPEGTLYVNEITRKTMIEGVAQAEVDRMLHADLRAAVEGGTSTVETLERSGWGSRWWVVGVNVVVIVFLAMLIAYRRRLRVTG